MSQIVVGYKMFGSARSLNRWMQSRRKKNPTYEHLLRESQRRRNALQWAEAAGEHNYCDCVATEGKSMVDTIWWACVIAVFAWFVCSLVTLFPLLFDFTLNRRCSGSSGKRQQSMTATGTGRDDCDFDATKGKSMVDTPWWSCVIAVCAWFVCSLVTLFPLLFVFTLNRRCSGSSGEWQYLMTATNTGRDNWYCNPIEGIEQKVQRQQRERGLTATGAEREVIVLVSCCLMEALSAAFQTASLSASAYFHGGSLESLQRWFRLQTKNRSARQQQFHVRVSGISSITIDLIVLNH